MVRGPIRQTQPTACRKDSDPQITTETHETRRSIHSRQSRLAQPPASRPIAARVPQGPSLRPLRGCGTRARAAVGRPHAPSALTWAHGRPDDEKRPPRPSSIRYSVVRFNVYLQDAPAEGCERTGSGWQGGQGGQGGGRGRAATRCGGLAATHLHRGPTAGPTQSHRTFCVALEICCSGAPRGLFLLQ